MNPRTQAAGKRRNGVMMDVLPDLPPSPSFHPAALNDGAPAPRLHRRPARTRTEFSSSSRRSASDTGPAIWTDQSQLVSSPELLSAPTAVDAGGQQSIFAASQQQQPYTSVLQLYDEPTPRADQTTFRQNAPPMRPAPTPIHPRHGPRAPKQRSTTSGESQHSASSGSVDTGYSRGSQGSHTHARAATDFTPPPPLPQPSRPRVLQSRPPPAPPVEQPRSVSDGSVTSPRYAHVRAATDFVPQEDDRGAFAPPRLVQQPQPRSASGSSLGSATTSPRNAHARAATDFAPSFASISESYPTQSPRPRHQQTADSSASASSSQAHPAFQQRQQTVDTTTSSSSRGSPAKFSPPALFRKHRHGQYGSESSSASAGERHLKGKASASTLSPPTSPPATHSNATVQREPSQGWQRVRTHVQQQQQQGKSKLFQFQQIWGRAAALSSSSDNQHSSAGSQAQAHQRQASLGVEPRSRLEEDVVRALWTARFGHGGSGSGQASAAGSSFALPLPLGSSVHLPFASAGGKQHKNSQSQSFPTSSSSGTTSSVSVKPLAAALRPYIPPLPAPVPGHERQLSSASLDLDYGDADGREKPVLPREEDVLRVLASAPPEEAEDAFEVFEMILRGWDAGSAKGHLDRALWLVRAAKTTRYGLGAMVLRTLSHVLFYSPAARRWPISSVAALQTLIAALLELQCALATTSRDQGLLLNVQGISNQVVDGECGALDMGDVERAYGVRAGRVDRAPSGAAFVRRVLARDAVVKALEHGAFGVRAWVLVNVLELEWGDDDDDDDADFDEDMDEGAARAPKPPPAMTPLQAHIAARATHRFLVVSPALLRSHDDAPRAALRLLASRILPNVGPTDDAAAPAVGLALELLALHEGAPIVVSWCQDSRWRETFERELASIIARAEWPAVIRVVHALSGELSGELQARAMGLAIPKLLDRLANALPPPARDSTALASLLAHLSSAHKVLFYKPVIQCATSAKELSVIAHLRMLQAVARLLPDFWIADSELMALALLGEAGRLGQSALALQMIEDVRRRAGGKTSRAPSAAQTQAVKFYSELETRIAVLTTAREKSTPLAFSHRLLIVALLLEIRQFTWSPKSTPWLPRVLNWTLHALPPEESQELAEVGATISKIRNVYMGCSDAQVSTARQSRSTLLFSPTSLEPVDQMLGMNATAQDESMSVFAALPSQLAAGCAKLLVLVSQLLSPSDTEQLGPVLWSRYLDSEDTNVLEPASFLVMHVAEWRPAFADMVRDDLQSHFPSVRRKAVQRLSVLFAWRFQIMSQAFISDRSRRRPFHTTRRALSFVPVDVGSGNFVLEENEAELKARFGDALPRDTIRRLLEIDWVQENKPPDKRLELIRTPFSVLPSSQMDRGIEAAPDSAMSPSPSGVHTSSSGNLSPSSPGGSPGKPHLMRRKSSTSSSIGVVKRRPVFVQSLLGVLPALAVTVRDVDVFISSAARDLLVDFMREDAATLCRPLMDTISSDGLQIVRVIDSIRAFLHVQQILPPAMSHIVFTHLAGFLRGVSRVEKDKPVLPANNLLTFAYTVPILAKLVAQVSNLSAQDLRRAKAEVFLLPSGPLWFSSAAPLGPMFPRDIDEAGNVPQRDTLDEIPPSLVAMTMIRTSQNMLLLALLKRNPQDITVVRKNLNRLVLPTRESSSGLKQLVVGDFIPRSPEAMRSKARDLGLARISIALSRSYLLLVAQIFRCLPRTLSDRAELGRLLDGVNRILLTHGDDIGIVSHALIACMVATTRFRRLFSSSSAFTLFMPSLIKVYCEATNQAGIRRAIEYAMNRFYQFHEDVVIFQTLDIASYMAAHPSAEPILASLASGLVSLMSSLKSPPIAADGDAAGIHGINRDQEQEAWDAITIEKKPEALPALLQSRADAANDAKSIATLEASQPKRFVTNNLVKFLLTIIAHDTTILRSEQFLRLLRCMTPSLYNMSASARTMLREGINALGIAIFLRPAAPATGDAAAQSRNLFSSDYGDGGVLLGNPLTPCDFAVMRREYLRLIVAFSKAGGALHNPTMRRALDLVKSMLKDPSDDVFLLAERFIVDYIKASHAGDVYKDTNATVYQLREYAPVFQAWCHKCDFSGVLTVLDQLASNPTFAQDYAFSQMVMEQFLRPAVLVCDRLAIEGTLFSSNLRLTVVPLLSTALTLSGVDPIGCIEQCSASPAFLAGIVLPLCFKLRTSTEAAAQIVAIKPFTRDAHGRAWLRLLSFALDACNPGSVKSRPGSRPSSRPSTPDGEKDRPSSLAQTPVATLAIVLQIIKIIVIRAEGDLSTSYRGVWDHLGAFLLHILDGGNAEFGLRDNGPRSISLVLTPSPRMANESLPTPRALDYFMWSMLHLVCAHRSPLMTPIRLRILEVTATLHTEMKRRHLVAASSPVRNSRRLSSSMFAKPRVRSLASAPVTPEMSPVASPQMTPTRANPFAPRSPSYLSLASPPSAHDATYRGRNRFPDSVTPERTPGRRILHLGLAANQQQPMTLTPSLSASNTAGGRASAIALMNNLASVQTITTSPLIRTCIKNVRLVQIFTGYETLLPAPDTDEDYGMGQSWDEQATVLSKAGALELVSRETALLIQEFRSEFYAPAD